MPEAAGSYFAYYDRDADIAWIPTGPSDDVVSERVTGGLREYDRVTRRLVAIEVWDASTRLPASLLDALPPAPEPGPRSRTGALDSKGHAVRPARRGLPEPLRLDGDPRALSRALDEVRGNR